MAIDDQTQGDWQELDPRSEEEVREVERDIVLNGILRVTPAEIRNLFTSTNSQHVEALANTIATRLNTSVSGIDVGTQERISQDMQTHLSEARQREQSSPELDPTKRLQRQAREFSYAVRRAIPEHIIGRNRVQQRVGVTWNPGISINGIPNVEIDLTNNFWKNRMQTREELVESLTNLPMNQAGLIDTRWGTRIPVTSSLPISAVKANAIVDSRMGGTGAPFHQRLLESRLRTLFSNEQVSSYNVETAIQMAMANNNVLHSVVPSAANAAEAEKENLQQEQRIASALSQLQSVEVPSLNSPTETWKKVSDAIDEVEADKKTLNTESRKSPPETGDLNSIGVLSTSLSSVSTQRNNEVMSLMRQLNDKKKELIDIDRKLKKYSDLLVSINQDVREMQARKASGSSLDFTTMIDASGAAQKGEFNDKRSPHFIASQLRKALELKSSPEEYKSLIDAKDAEAKKAETGANMLTGRDAVLEVYDKYYKLVKDLDPRRAEEAKQTLYARNEQGREEHEARNEAVGELVGRNQRIGERVFNNRVHNFFHGRPEDIICKLAETNTINAPTDGTRMLLVGPRWNDAITSGTRALFGEHNFMNTSPKWSALNYPQLMTAFAALRKLREDNESPIELQQTAYYRKQMNKITTLLVDKFTEKVEQDYARVEETEEQKNERKAQGERNRKQRLIRLMLHSPVPAAYTERADSAIKEASKRVRRVRRGIAATGRFAGKLSLKALALPVKAGKGFWNLINKEV